MEEQSQVEELQKNLQEQGSKADDVSKCLYSCTHVLILYCVQFQHQFTGGSKRRKQSNYTSESALFLLTA